MSEFGYKVICGRDPESLCTSVLELAKEGWEPLGSIAITWVPISRDGHGKGWLQYAQAMVKRRL